VTSELASSQVTLFEVGHALQVHGGALLRLEESSGTIAGEAGGALEGARSRLDGRKDFLCPNRVDGGDGKRSVGGAKVAGHHTGLAAGSVLVDDEVVVRLGLADGRAVLLHIE
jgi:hypothetical protein